MHPLEQLASPICRLTPRLEQSLGLRQRQRSEIDRRLARAMYETYHRVSEYARNNDVDMRIACYALALERLREAYEMRGIFP